MPLWGAMLAALIVGGVLALWYTGAGGSATEAAPSTSTTSAPVEAMPAASFGADIDVALFIGDSYTAGEGASSSGTRWASLVADDEGWYEVNYGRGGTGYDTVSGEEGCGREFCDAYSGTLDEAAVAGVTADIVLIAGGQNDTEAWEADREAVAEAIDATYARARQLFPTARIVAVGPSWLGAIRPWHRAFDRAVQDAAAAVDAEYVSLLDPPVLKASYDDGDGVHVDDAGHAAIAKRVVSELG
ncbi:SGNH/GDSL hydrolase family protein [Demequina maris]|uniref:SGNH/GDSL hydrolase family protein n=1 Tax=Demequina maris TaxID=1638982 RepID=UPI0007823089|nr:SGNH/GDSL hydrolase family protein [Demequina maris]